MLLVNPSQPALVAIKTYDYVFFSTYDRCTLHKSRRLKGSKTVKLRAIVVDCIHAYDLLTFALGRKAEKQKSRVLGFSQLDPGKY